MLVLMLGVTRYSQEFTHHVRLLRTTFSYHEQQQPEAVLYKGANYFAGIPVHFKRTLLGEEERRGLIKFRMHCTKLNGCSSLRSDVFRFNSSLISCQGDSTSCYFRTVASMDVH